MLTRCMPHRARHPNSNLEVKQASECSLTLTLSPRYYNLNHLPDRKRSPMKPPERAPPSKAAKQGSVLPVSMRGTRLPSNSCMCRGLLSLFLKDTWEI